MCCVCLLSCRQEPSEQVLRESFQLDSLNQVMSGEIQQSFQRMVDLVIDQGVRSGDVQELEKMNAVREEMDSLLSIIEIKQKQFVSAKETSANDRQGIELSGLKQAYEQLPFIEGRCERLIPFDSLGFTSNLSPGWMYVGLTKMESALLNQQICFSEDQFSRIGLKDHSFDIIPYATDGTGVVLDTADLDWSDESYNFFLENPFYNLRTTPVSTFSADLDRASYTNIRRYLNFGAVPPREVVRLEEMVNYFDYNYPEPEGKVPVALDTEYGDFPWNKNHKLLRIGLKSRDILLNTPHEALPANNLVFLIDVSGSMESENKLPLVKSSLKLLTRKLRPIDHVSIVVSSSRAGVVLENTSGEHKETIIRAIDSLDAGGGTSGSAGIRKAHQLAKRHYKKGGNNRVIIATDGDFNVGVSTEGGLHELIQGYRDSGIYLTVLGFGMGNYRDDMLRTLSNHGNGNYAYIDDFMEARNVFEIGFTGTFYTVAKDVKLQVEFNPEYVQGYRLLGYEDRILALEDFVNDQVDAGDMGSGHAMTAFYEIIPVGVSSEYLGQAPKLKYQQTSINSGINELATVRFRYKDPEEYNSEEVVSSVAPALEGVSADFELASSVIEFGLLLRNSAYRADANYDQVLERLTKNLVGHIDEEKWRELLENIAVASRITLAE